MDVSSCSRSEQVETTRTSPVGPLGWRELRWLKRRGIVVFPARLGPPSGSASRGVAYGGTRVGDCKRALRHCVVHGDPDVVADVECDDSDWCHERIEIGYSTRLRLNRLATASVAVSSLSSSCSSVCPPSVLSAPGHSSFLSPSIPLPPAHSALGCDDVGDRRSSFGSGCTLARPLCAVASVARLGSSASLASVGSSVSSRGSLHSAGSRRLPSHNVVPVRRPVRFHQSKCCNVSSQRGRGVPAASVSTPSVATTQSSGEVILNRQVIVVDLGLAGSGVIAHSGSVVGSVSGRQPQQLQSSLHCVLRLRGGASSSTWSDDYNVVGEVDVSSASSVDLVNEAVGSGNGNDRGGLNDGNGCTARLVSAGVPAREEGRRSRVFDHIVEQEGLFASIMGRNQGPVPQPPIVGEHGHLMLI